MTDQEEEYTREDLDYLAHQELLKESLDFCMA